MSRIQQPTVEQIAAHSQAQTQQHHAQLELLKTNFLLNLQQATYLQLLESNGTLETTNEEYRKLAYIAKTRAMYLGEANGLVKIEEKECDGGKP